jgi:hypothetical protein
MIHGVGKGFSWLVKCMHFLTGQRVVSLSQMQKSRRYITLLLLERLSKFDLRTSTLSLNSFFLQLWYLLMLAYEAYQFLLALQTLGSLTY